MSVICGVAMSDALRKIEQQVRTPFNAQEGALAAAAAINVFCGDESCILRLRKGKAAEWLG